MLSFVLIFDHVREISVPCLLTDRRAFDMASHPDYGVSGCCCFGEFRDFVWDCFEVVQTCQSATIFLIGKENIVGLTLGYVM